MQIFIDTADLNEIRTLNETGLIDGVTTNPSLAARQGMKVTDLIKEICAIVDGHISAEVIALDTPGMIDQGKKLAALHPNVIVKVPLTVEGLKACYTLTEIGIAVNVTLCFSAPQALLAAKAGARYISPFVGRLDDQGGDGMQLIRDIKEIYTNYMFNTEILAASIRHPHHVVEAAKVGADVCTIPPAIFRQLYEHNLTKIGLNAFMADWEKSCLSL